MKAIPTPEWKSALQRELYNHENRLDLEYVVWQI